MARARRPGSAGRAGANAPAQTSLLESAQFRQLIDTAPDAMVIVDERGSILVVNSQTLKLFGYAPDELIGNEIEILIPERFRVRHANHHRAGYVAEASPHARAIGDGRGLFGRRKDGSEFPAQISLTPLRTDSGILISSFIRDLSPLAESEARHRSLFEDVPLGLFVSTPEGVILDANPELVRILGYPDREALMAVRTPDLYAQMGDRARYLAQTERDGVVRGFPTMLKRRDGTTFPAELSARAVKDSGGHLVRVHGSVADVSQRQNLEAQLIQAQKMEAVGLLAGGIAHDFNNLLGAITVFGELAAADLPQGDRRREDLESIQEAVARATTLTRQLLTFSRHQVLRPKVLDPNAVIGDVLKILGRLIGEDIELITELDPNCGRVRADESQLEQVLMNLAVNARDAMPNGGRITISTTHVHLDEMAARVKGLERGGEYVVLSMSDTGSGMAADVQGHVFEPFFTTKGAKGTGLGLATVYGIVKQSGGHVGVASEPGRGTTFMIHLPAVSGLTAEHPVAAAEAEASGGDETILVAEDDPAVRLAVTSVLGRLGYTVLVARSAEDALATAAAHNGPIHLAISDVVMPGRDGPDLIAGLRKVRPDMRALLTSGYAGDAIGQHRVTESGVPFLEKPFTATRLARRVREVLDGQLPSK